VHAMKAYGEQKHSYTHFYAGRLSVSALAPPGERSRSMYIMGYGELCGPVAYLDALEE
jgi:hypothetical protein